MFLQTGGPIRNQSKEADPGAALEAIVARKLISLELINPTTRCIQKQDQDTAAISRLDPALKQKFEKAGMLIAKLILKRFIVDDSFCIDRTDDRDDSVEDIVLFNELQRFNFSIKHNNDSIKHNRPFSLISNGMGFGEGTTEDQDHRNRLIKVCDDFRSNNSNVSKFSDLEINTKENLYFELITECKISLDKYSSNPIAAQNLFNFIVGKDYIKIKVLTNKKDNDISVIYEDFREGFIQPNGIEKVEIYKGSRKADKAASWNLRVEFDNKYIFTHRIHNGGSAISHKNQSQLNMKFDVKFDSNSKRGSELT